MAFHKLHRAYTIQNDDHIGEVVVPAITPIEVVFDTAAKGNADSNNNFSKYPRDLNDITEFPVDFSWDWPFCDEGAARGVLKEDRFIVCLPFSKAGCGGKRGITKKFEKISESNFSYSIGLQNGDERGPNFWRIEIEILRNLNMLSLIASRDISRRDELTKRLRRVRKVYRLPDQYDVSTLQTSSCDWAIILEASRRPIKQPKNPQSLMKRAESFE